MRGRADPKLQAMSRVPLFAGLSQRDLGRIARLADEVDIPAGQSLTREGETGREFFVLLGGEADVRRGGRKLRTLGAGDIVGEIALLSDVPRTATVTARTDLHALLLTARAFRQLLRDEPRIQLKVLQTLADRVATLER